MRLEELFLDGFGHFHQRTFSLACGRVTVFYGPNEAGKSTLMAFIRTVLLGFPGQNRNAHYPPLAGGRHGGRIRLSGDDGQFYTIQRYVGTRGGTVEVLNDTGESLDPADFMPRITGQASQSVFNHVFAFGIDELQRVELLDDSSVNEAIYSAGQGVPGLSGFRQRLATRQQEIFLSNRGTSQEIPALVKTIREIDEQLTTIAGNANRYGSLMSRRAAIDTELQALEVERSQSNSRLSDLRNLTEGWEDWVELNDCESRLKALPLYVHFPDEAISRLEAFQERIRVSKTDRDEAAERLRVTTEAAAAVIPDEALLEEAGRVEEIRRGRGGFDESVRDLPERQAELREMEAGFVSRAADLGRPWDEADLEAFDTSLVVRNQVDSWKDRLAHSGETLRRAELRLEQEKQTLLDRQLDTRESGEQLPGEAPVLDEVGLADQQDALRTARGCLTEFERQRQNHENLRGQLNVLTSGTGSRGGKPAPIPVIWLVLLALAGAALAVIGVFLGGQALLLGVAGGLILIIVAIVLWFSGRAGPSPESSPVTSPLARQAEEAEKGMEFLRQALLTAAERLDLAGQPDGAALESAEARLVSIGTQIGAWSAANHRLEEAFRREHSQEQRLADAAKAQEVAAASHEEAQEEWGQWLRECQLDDTLTPEGMTSFLANIDAARGVLGETRRMRTRGAAIETDIEEFRQKVEPLAAVHTIALAAGNWGQLATAADTLISRLEQAREAQSRRQAAVEQRDADRRAVDEREQRLMAAQQELNDFMALGETDDPEDFRLRARDHDTRVELDRNRNELRRSLERLSGPGERFDAFRERLAGTDQIRLNEESGEVAGQIQEMEERRGILLEERGGIENELERLTGEEESSRLRVKRETLVAQLQESAREWSKLTFAQELLERTRQKFEVERQPRVVQHAQDFFSRITGQRYTRLFVPIGERSVTVMDGAGGHKRPQELSRGTREQLYLSLRFGLVREFGEHAERLPVVVDEVLVNFDPERARLAAESFAELSETNQVLVFTCHPGMAELFTDVAGAQVIDVEPARVAST
jgi:uncharacterized protein YhaN